MYQFFFKKRRLSYLVILFVAFAITTSAQDLSKIDSLKETLDTVGERQRYDVLVELVLEYAKSDNKIAYRYAQESLELANRIGDTLLIVQAGRLKGQIQRRVEDLEGAIEIFNQVLPMARRNSLIEEEKKILNALALTHTFRGDYDEALRYHFESLAIREREGKKDEISLTLNNIGLVYFKLKNHDKALEYYFRSLEIKKSINDNTYLDGLYNNIGLCYNQKEEFSKARSFFRQAFEACGDNCSENISVEIEFGLSFSFLTEFKALMARGKDSEMTRSLLDSSEYHSKKSYEIAHRIGHTRFQMENLLNLARVSDLRNDENRSIQYLTEAETLARATNHKQILIDVYKEFSIVFNQTNNFEKASFYQNKYINLKDSVYSEQLIKNIAEVQTEYAERENIATIASKEQALKQQRDLNIAVVIIAMLAGLLILVLQRSNRTIKRVNAQLSEAKEVIEDQNKQLEDKNKYLDREVEEKTIDLERANQSLKQVNDELDNFIYKTSHDIRGPLASLKGMCNVALMDVKDAVALDYLRKLDSTAERLNTILTRLLIINQINNSKLSISKIDFDGIVRDVLLLEKKKGLPQKLNIRQKIEPNKSINSDKELIRIVLENLIDNAIKFYNDSDRVDSFVEINIVPAPLGHVKIRVIDNGIGISESNPGKLFRMFFRASERSETGGIGLYIVKTATAKLGGKVGLLTTPDGFTEFFVDFPPNPPAPEDGPDKPSIY